jgi:hypothetical protein
MTEGPSFDELFAECKRSAVHLEMRDEYTPDDPVFAEWRAGVAVEVLVSRWREWFDLLSASVARGVEARRARVVSEPVTDFIRYEYDVTPALNLAAGEQVRWLPRRQASGLLLPVNDFWVFDDRLVRLGYFAGNGEYLGSELNDDPPFVTLCTSAFEAVWRQGIDHADYEPA